MLFGLRVVMLGRQGSGKGTQGMQLARLLVVPHISVGDPLHEASRSGSLADSGPGECTAGMHARTLTFTASTRGTYRYLCRSPATRRRHGRPLHCPVIRLNADVHTPTFWIAAGPSARCQGTEVSTPRG